MENKSYNFDICLRCVYAVVVLALASAPARATDRYVWAGGAHTNGFTNWACAATNIQAAVNACASSGDIVWVTNGVYSANSTVGLAGNYAMVNITNAVELRGVNGRDYTFINGNFPACTNRGIYANNANALVMGFTITNAFGPDWGGGVVLQSGTVADCTIRNNRARYSSAGVRITGAGLVSNCFICFNMMTNTGGYAGGARLENAASRMQNCVISNNASASSPPGLSLINGMLENCEIVANAFTAPNFNGAGVNMSGGKMKGCTIADNTGALRGGGITASGGLIENCTIRGHAIGAQGGGIYFTGAATAMNCRVVGNMTPNNGGGGGAYVCSDAAMIGCLISGNWAGATSNLIAGGVAMIGGLLRNCTITANAGNDGAGVYLILGTPLIENCTIVSNNNTSANRGAVLVAAPAAATVRNCVIYFNRNGNLVRGGGDTITHTCTTPAAAGEGNITDDPGFVSLDGMDLRLLRRSPCVDSGMNADWMYTATDCAGNPRVLGGRVDMGAHETRIPRGTVFDVE